VNASASPGRAEVTWWVSSGASGVTIQLNSGSGWATVAVRDADGSGRLHFQDLEVLAGRRYGYRLLLAGPSGATPVSEVWLDVPASLGFTLGGFEPNPAVGDARVAFTLGSSAPARLLVLDVAGRAVLSRDVGALGPGSHVMPVQGAAAGVYVLRLTQGGRTLTRKATLLP
jgi:hypothetical protein